MIYGVGINDSLTPVTIKLNGKQVWKCPIYQSWKDIIRRCYDSKFQDKNKTYIGCTVCDEWLTFSNFKAWMEKQDWEGKQVDKDLLCDGNMEYAPDKCLLLDHALNSFFTDSRAARGELPIGVVYDARCGSYLSRVGSKGSYIHLGSFSNKRDAFEAWANAKREVSEFHKSRLPDLSLLIADKIEKLINRERNKFFKETC